MSCGVYVTRNFVLLKVQVLLSVSLVNNSLVLKVLVCLVVEVVVFLQGTSFKSIMNNSVNIDSQSNNLEIKSKYLCRFQEENTCLISLEFLERYPECILNEFIKTNKENTENEIYVDFTIHYPDLLISIINEEFSDSPLDDSIDFSLLRDDYFTLFPNRNGKINETSKTLCKPIVDYCYKSKDIIRNYDPSIYSCNPNKSSGTFCSHMVHTLNSQDKYVYIVNGDFNEKKINELKKLSLYLTFFDFVVVCIQSTITYDLDIATIVNTRHLTIFPSLPSLDILFHYYTMDTLCTRDVCFSFKENRNTVPKTYYMYKINLFKMHDPPFVKWILNNPYKDTIEEVNYSETDALTEYMSIFKKNFYPSIKNIHFSEDLNIDVDMEKQIPRIISFFKKNRFPNLKKISFQGCISNGYLLTNCTKSTELFEEINLKGASYFFISDCIKAIKKGLFPEWKHIMIDKLPPTIIFDDLIGFQSISERILLPPIYTLTITSKAGLLGFKFFNNLNQFDERWNSLFSLFGKISKTLKQLFIEKNMSVNTIQDMIELFTPLTFTKLTNLDLNCDDPITFMPSLLLFLSSSSYPSLQSLTIQCESFNNQVPTEYIQLSFEDLQKQSIHLKMPCLKTLTFTNLYFNSESLRSTLALFLTSCPSMEQLTFESCGFDNQCDNALLTVAKQGLMKHIQYLNFDSFTVNLNNKPEYTSFFVPRYFCNLEKGQLSSLNSLYYSYLKFTTEDFQNYVSLFTNHIIPSTCFSLTNPNDTNYSKTIIPSEGINYLLDAIKEKKMTHLTMINLEYGKMSLAALRQFISYLNKDYLPHLTHFYIDLRKNEITNDIEPLMNHNELVKSQQLHYKISSLSKTLQNESKTYIPERIIDSFLEPYKEKESIRLLNTTENVLNESSKESLGTIVTGSKRHIENEINTHNYNAKRIYEEDDDNNNHTSDLFISREEKTNNDSIQHNSPFQNNYIPKK
ncbi:hypothetical protein WA158_007135 [Blastocystis sp. Blastoise]